MTATTATGPAGVPRAHGPARGTTPVPALSAWQAMPAAARYAWAAKAQRSGVLPDDLDTGSMTPDDVRRAVLFHSSAQARQAREDRDRRIEQLREDLLQAMPRHLRYQPAWQHVLVRYEDRDRLGSTRRAIDLDLSPEDTEAGWTVDAVRGAHSLWRGGDRSPLTCEGHLIYERTRKRHRTRAS